MEREDGNVILNIPSTGSNHVKNNKNPNSVSQVDTKKKQYHSFSMQQSNPSPAWPINSRPILSSSRKKHPSSQKPSPIEVLGSRNVSFNKNRNGNNGWGILDLVEAISFLILLSLLIASLAIDSLTLWEVEVWRFSILIIIIVCGNLVTKVLTNFITFLIQKANNYLKSHILYVLYVIIKSSRALLWLGLILLLWISLIKGRFDKSSRTHDEQRVLNKITRAMACTLVGTSLWMLKTFLVKLLASSFQLRTFFDRVRNAIFFQYVFRQFSGGNGKSGASENMKEAEREWERVEKLFILNRDSVSAFFMTQLIEEINVYGLTEKRWTEYEKEAKFVSARMLKIVASEGKEYIDEVDLGRFLPSGAIHELLQLVDESVEDLDSTESLPTTGISETPHIIEKSSFESWMFDAYKELKCLAYSLNNSNTAIDEFNNICSTLVLILIVIVWLLLMGITTTEVLVFISSQLLTWGFIFSDTLKSVLEGIVFIFVAHPFDIADQCVIDEIEMVVDEMSLLKTTFLRNDIEKIHYSNSVLAAMRISNFNRSSKMTEIVEFGVDISTSAQSLSTLQKQLKGYLESANQHWLKNHTLQITEADDENKEMKMILNVTHMASVQPSQRKTRRSDLVLHLTRILDGLDITYQIIPQSGSS